MKQAIKNQFATLKANLEEAAHEIECEVFIQDCTDELQEAFDNKSEKWQESDKGEEAQQRIADLEAIQEKLQELKDLASEIVDLIDEL